MRYHLSVSLLPYFLASPHVSAAPKIHIDIVYMFSYCCIMTIEYSLHGIRFEWNSNKSETNLRKHGIDFEKTC